MASHVFLRLLDAEKHWKLLSLLQPSFSLPSPHQRPKVTRFHETVRSEYIDQYADGSVPRWVRVQESESELQAKMLIAQ